MAIPKINISVRLPLQQIEYIDSLVEDGLYKHRVDYIMELIEKEMADKEQFIDEQIKFHKEQYTMYQKRKNGLAKVQVKRKNHLKGLLSDDEFVRYISMFKRYFDGTNPTEMIYDIEQAQSSKLKEFEITMDEFIDLGKQYFGDGWNGKYWDVIKDNVT